MRKEEKGKSPDNLSAVNIYTLKIAKWSPHKKSTYKVMFSRDEEDTTPTLVRVLGRNLKLN